MESQATRLQPFANLARELGQKPNPSAQSFRLNLHIDDLDAGVTALRCCYQ